jgi:hypothetical protein
MPNTPRPRKVKKLLKKLAKGKSADKFLQDLSDKKFQPGTSEPTKTPQTDVMGRPLESSDTSKKGVPQTGNKAQKLAEKAQKAAQKAAEKAAKKEEKAEKKKKKKLRTPQTRGVMDAPRRG